MQVIAGLRELLRQPHAPIEVPGFQHTYRTTRIAANAAAFVGALTIGPFWADRALLVLPVIAGLAAVLLVHSYAQPHADWRTMSLLDTPAYVVMFVMMGATAAIPFVAVTQAFIGFLFVPARLAVRMTAAYTLLALVGIGLSDALQLQDLTLLQYVFLIGATTSLTIGPATWALLSAGAEIVRHRAARDALAAEKDELLASRDRFVASISHELRTPLTSVVGLAHTLTEPELPLDADERADLMRLLVQESEEVAAIVEDLLVAARAQSGQLSLSPRSIPLVPEVMAVVEAAGLSSVDVSFDPVSVIGDPVRIRQIIRNLVTNAVRYGGPKRSIRVSVDGPWGVLAIVDNGPGIPEDRLETVFSAYGRAHDRPGLTDSVGLGLTVSRQLARLMGGDVEYRRHDGMTTFSLRLPAAAPATAPQTGTTGVVRE